MLPALLRGCRHQSHWPLSKPILIKISSVRTQPQPPPIAPQDTSAGLTLLLIHNMLGLGCFILTKYFFIDL